LKVLFDARRARGRKVSERWIQATARSLIRQLYPRDTCFKASHGWFLKFAGRAQLSHRSKTNMRSESISDRLPRIRIFHSRLRHELNQKRLITTNQHDSLWGQYPPKFRYNVDQIPLPFINDQKTTWARRGDKTVWIRQAGSGAFSKRQATIQLCCSPVDGPQPRVALIFRGKGVRISIEERAAYHPDVDVYFQPKAWADTAFYDQWIEQTLKPALKDIGGEVLLLCDNLSCQTSSEFRNKVQAVAGARVWNIPPTLLNLFSQSTPDWAATLNVKLEWN
jgi:hypothetical protein